MKKYLPFLLAYAFAIGILALLATTVLQAPSIEVGEGVATTASQLQIEKLGVQANVEEVGRTPSGAMANPSTFYDVAWFKEGPKPGEEGSAVVAGHVDNALGLSGVFKDLDQLRPGDEVSYHSPSSGALKFRVTRVEVYEYQKVPLDEVFEKTGGRYLHLVTCAGEWVPEAKTYSHRLVVYAEQV